MTDSAQAMLAGLLTAARLNVQEDLAALFVDQGKALGAVGVTVYLVDHEQYRLVPLPRPDGVEGESLSVEGTLAGRCFRHLDVLRSAAAGRARLWAPILDGLERLGVLELEFPPGGVPDDDTEVNAFAALIAELVMVKDGYGDLFAKTRRRQPMSLAAEIAWNLLPPLTFGTDRLVITAVLAPAYDVGGDSFDYAVDATTARFAVFDAMGHGLDAGWLATVAIGAYRNFRRRDLDLPGVAAGTDAAIERQFGGDRFVTALLAELDLASGALCWHTAGHPPPLLLRSGQVVKALEADPGLPLGLGGPRELVKESLEPGDRVVLFTDGVVEARSESGELFGVDRLAELVVREDAAGHPAPETMRRLMHAILAHQEGELQDDATTMLVEWRGGGAERITP